MTEQSRDQKVAIDKVRNIQMQWKIKTIYNHKGYLDTVSFIIILCVYYKQAK